MNTREDIITEIKSISASLAAIPFVNVFTVNEAYFKTLPEIIISQINVGKDIHSAKKLSVPEGYFETLAVNILNKIHSIENNVAAELSEISPLLANIHNKETYTVPQGYFNKLSFAVDQRKTVKVISINKPGSFFKYAAAAVITGLLGLSIVNIVATNNSDNHKILTAEIMPVTTNSNTVVLNGNFDEALNNISEIEIEQYLQNNGHDVKAALVASSTDDIEKLPEASEYLFDENVLENYLKKNNLKN